MLRRKKDGNKAVLAAAHPGMLQSSRGRSTEMADNQKKQLKPWPKKYPGVHVSKTSPVGPDPYRPTRTDMGQVPDQEPDQE